MCSCRLLPCVERNSDSPAPPSQLCKKSITSRAIVLILRKKAASAEFWPRLTKEKVKNLWIKTDFSKWVDEDEQEGAAGIDESEFSGAGGGPGGMPGGSESG